MQNYPNPFNPVTIINYELPITNYVKLSVYDILGREVGVLVNEKLTAGKYKVEWDGTNYPSGVYFYRLTVSGASAPLSIKYSETKKMIFIIPI
jgi:flagellar hook assembly protein FlgD